MEVLKDLAALVADPRGRAAVALFVNFLVDEQKDDKEVWDSQDMPALLSKVARFCENTPQRSAAVQAFEDCLADCMFMPGIGSALHGLNFRKWDVAGIQADVAERVNIEDLRRLIVERWQRNVDHSKTRGDHHTWGEATQLMMKPADASTGSKKARTAVRVAHHMARERECVISLSVCLLDGVARGERHDGR
jgi:hypothetical protein